MAVRRAAIATSARMVIAALLLAAVGWFVVPRARRALIWSLVTYDAAPGEADPAAAAAHARTAAAGRAAHARDPDRRAVGEHGRRVAGVERAVRPRPARDDRRRLPDRVARGRGRAVDRPDAATERHRLSQRCADRAAARRFDPGAGPRLDRDRREPRLHRALARVRERAAGGVAPQTPAKDADPDNVGRHLARARRSVGRTSPSSLVFVHVLRVDTAGHKHGGASPEYAQAAREADAILAELVAAAPDARWFALSDHGHIAAGGHGGEEDYVRRGDRLHRGPRHRDARRRGRRAPRRHRARARRLDRHDAVAADDRPAARRCDPRADRCRRHRPADPGGPARDRHRDRRARARRLRARRAQGRHARVVGAAGVVAARARAARARARRADAVDVDGSIRPTRRR